MLDKIVDWFKYPSSWASIVGALSVFGVHVSPENTQLIAQAGVAIVTAIFAFYSDADVKED